jgi:hypothetical protein
VTRNVPDNIYTGTALCLSSVRLNTWTDAQRVTLDDLIQLLCDDYEERSHRFNRELFCSIARYGHLIHPPKEIA